MAIDDGKRMEWSAALRSNLEGLSALHGIVMERAARLKVVEDVLGEAIARVAREKADEGSALAALSAASDDAVRRARLAGVKLEAAFLEGGVEESTYRAALTAAFPQGAQSIGATPALRLEAMRRIASALEAHPEADPSDTLVALALEGATKIEDANAQAKRELEETRAANEALVAARAEFDVAYLATKEIVTGLCREAKRLDELRDVFPDR